MPGLEGIAGVRIVALTTKTDPRGSFTELFRQALFPGVRPMAQCNLSHSRPGVLRGMHFHREQADYWCVLEGRALIALYDLRAGSPTERYARSMEIDASEGHRGLYIPPGVAHGFLSYSEVGLLYLVDRHFDGTDEFGFSWNDPDFPIAWPIAEPTVSDRDAVAPALAQVLEDPPRWVDLPALGT